MKKPKKVKRTPPASHKKVMKLVAQAKKLIAKKELAKKPTLVIVNLKVTPRDRALLLAQAKKFSNGNLSAWLRHTGLKYVPAKAEAISKNPFKP